MFVPGYVLAANPNTMTLLDGENSLRALLRRMEMHLLITRRVKIQSARFRECPSCSNWRPDASKSFFIFSNSIFERKLFLNRAMADCLE